MQQEFVSKSQRKREMQELRALGAALVELPAGQLATLPVPEELAAAIREAQRITSHEARRRQVQYIGRLMRGIDAEPLRAAMAELEGASAATRARQKRLERWRARLIEDDAALTEFAREHGAADVQALRALIRNARRELAEGRAPHAQRDLFRRLREAVGEA